MRVKPLVHCLCLAAALERGVSIANGLGLTPPRGWRSWNLYHDKVNDTVMRAQMHAVLDASRPIANGSTGVSLAALGFDWISMRAFARLAPAHVCGSMCTHTPLLPRR